MIQYEISLRGPWPAGNCKSLQLWLAAKQRLNSFHSKTTRCKLFRCANLPVGSSIQANIPHHREILDLLGQLLGVFASLDSKWTKALLHRAQLSDQRFLGEVLNTFQLIATSLSASRSHVRIYTLLKYAHSRLKATADDLQPALGALPPPERGRPRRARL